MDFRGFLSNSLDAIIRNSSNNNRENIQETFGVENIPVLPPPQPRRSRRSRSRNHSSFVNTINDLEMKNLLQQQLNQNQNANLAQPIPQHPISPSQYPYLMSQNYPNYLQQPQSQQSQQHQPQEAEYLIEPSTITTRRYVITSSDSSILDELLRGFPLSGMETTNQNQNMYHSHQQQQKGCSFKKLADIPVRIVKESEKCELCPICHEAFQVDPFVNELSCGHIFHMDCISKWLKDQNTCPFCRFKI